MVIVLQDSKAINFDVNRDGKLWDFMRSLSLKILKNKVFDG